MSRYSTTLFEIFDLQKYAIKLGLENITYLSKIFDNPHLRYPTIHVAGTNGKGSTAIILQQILMGHGFKVGLYTSPHLVSFNERIRINNNLIENQFIINFWDTIKKFVLEKKATFFDTTTCLAFEYFYQRKVDVAIFETGLGGRLDSTNIIQPEATLLTPISFDHQKQLGNTLTDIAMEKAGIIKQNSHLFLGHQNEEVHSYFKSKFEFIHEITDQGDVIKSVKIQPGLNFTHFSFKDSIRNKLFKDFKLSLLGAYQVENACLAYLASRWYLENLNIDFNKNVFRTTLLNIQWPGRLQKISTNPDIYIDVSHNVQGFRRTLEFISNKYDQKHLHLLIGLLEDKEYKQIVKIVENHFSSYTVTEPEYFRRLKGQILVQEFAKYGILANFIKDIKKSFEISSKDLQKEDALLIIGSHHLASSILNQKNKYLT